MQMRTGDMWSVQGEADLFLFTSNAVINSKNELVMGAGFALEVKRRYPYLAREMAGLVISYSNKRRWYGVIRSLRCNLGAFQTKVEWKHNSIPELISFSTDRLIREVETFNLKRVHLNFPGIGQGALPEDIILPIIQRLPDEVTIWKRY